MSLLAELIASLRAMVDAARDSAGAIRASRDQVEGSLGRVRAATAGSDSPLVAEGDGYLQAALGKLDEAAALLEAGNQSWERYIAGPLLGSGSSGDSGAPPGSPQTPAAPEPRGWDSAPDLATARDGMPRLGEVPIMREVHILDGDGDGQSGGHRWDSAIPGKTKFPKSWDDGKILEAVSVVARNPDRPPMARPRGGWECIGTVDGVEIKAITNADGSVWTAHPLRGDGVETNPR